jgi:hypothetical protein
LETCAFSPSLTIAKRTIIERGARVSKTTSWLQLSLDIWRASLEAQQVIGLRLAKLTSAALWLRLR